MTLPPYFTTMTLPWYLISHGSASARVAALVVARSHISWSITVRTSASAAVGGVLVHVGVREVVGPDGGAERAGLEVDGHGHLPRGEVDGVRRLVRRRAPAHPDVVDGDVEVGWVEASLGGADAGEH